ncbi:unnamed protein product [Trichogramma brassicae]|uniref:Uncharacterized protein n=1 Tax=Trichogramma brassicae TaxID=86971 RepID=A0A6H5IQA9_9HYME|nr:unnamed protein product [Trichogramma brassicae]
MSAKKWSKTGWIIVPNSPIFDQARKDDKVIEEEVSICLGDLREGQSSNELKLIDEVATRVSEYLRLGLPKEEKKEILNMIPRKHKQFNLRLPNSEASSPQQLQEAEQSSNLHPDSTDEEKNMSQLLPSCSFQFASRKRSFFRNSVDYSELCWTRKRESAADTADRFTSERTERLLRTAGQIDGRSSGMKCITFACQCCTVADRLNQTRDRGHDLVITAHVRLQHACRLLHAADATARVQARRSPSDVPVTRCSRPTLALSRCATRLFPAPFMYTCLAIHTYVYTYVLYNGQ